MTTTPTPSRPGRAAPGSGGAAGKGTAKAGSGAAAKAKAAAKGSRPKPRARRRKGSAASAAGGRRSILWRSRRIVFALLLVLIAAMGGGFLALNSIALPVEATPAETSFVCLANVADGKCGPDDSVAQYSASENRIWLHYQDMPKVLVQAVLAAEDRTYFEHSGIDPVGIARALYEDVTSSGSTQGGSTITQQYVKTVFLSRERTLTRKLKEAALALKLERKYSKTEILERYLNVIYFGRGAYGVEAASHAYFDKPSRELTLDEAALLAGLIRAPLTADPTSNPTEAMRRRRSVLTAMAEVHDITPAEAAAADKVPFAGHVVARTAHTNNTTVQPTFATVGGEYITEWVRQQLNQKFGEGAVYTKGLRVYLTIDQSQQASAYQSIAKVLNKPGDPSASLVSIDDKGAIVSMVGGSDYDKNKVNYALGTAGGGSGRPPGSTFKPFALAAFVNQGYSVKSVFQAPPTITFPKADQGKPWSPSNYNDENFGQISVDDATWNSVNTVYAQIEQQVGAQSIADIAKQMGITAPIPAVPSVVLGTGEVSVLDLATAYSTFSNRGVLQAPFVIRRVEDSKGHVLLDQGQPQRTQALPQRVADTVTNVLRGVIDQGTGRAARVPKHAAAGKTGTTDNYDDAWFAGYTCHRTSVVWVGYPNAATPMTDVRGVKVAGGTFPAQIWHNYMTQATANDGACTYPQTDAGTKLATTLTVAPPTTTTTLLPGQQQVPPPTGVTSTTVPAKGSPTTVPTPTTAPLPKPTTKPTTTIATRGAAAPPSG
jgi:penicillin-binding protein 1A